MANELAAAIRSGAEGSFSAALSTDPRPLCVEHVEDLRGKPRTREEFCRLLRQAARRRPVLLTITRTRGDAELVRWLRSWTDLRSVD